MAVTRSERGWEEVKVDKGGHTYMVMEGDLALDGEHTMQHTDDILQNWKLEICIILFNPNKCNKNCFKK